MVEGLLFLFILAFELFQSYIEVALQSAIFDAARTQYFPQSLSQRQVIFLLLLAVPLRVKFLPAQFSEAVGQKFVIL